MKIAVTGATGYIGGRLVPRLLAEGHDVICLARNPDKLADRPWRDQVEVRRGDVLDRDQVKAALAGCDAAYYLIHSMGSATDFADADRAAALLAEADFVICPDSGPAHMATALGTSVVGLYATSNPTRTGPYLSQKYTINRYPDAISRYLDKNVADLRWGQRVRHPDAMDLITVADVVKKIDLFFEDRDN